MQFLLQSTSSSHGGRVLVNGVGSLCIVGLSGS